MLLVNHVSRDARKKLRSTARTMSLLVSKCSLVCGNISNTEGLACTTTFSTEFWYYYNILSQTIGDVMRKHTKILFCLNIHLRRDPQKFPAIFSAWRDISDEMQLAPHFWLPLCFTHSPDGLPTVTIWPWLTLSMSGRNSSTVQTG